MPFGHRSIPALLLALTLVSFPTAVLAGEEAEDCKENWYLCIAESTFDGADDYRGEWDEDTMREDVVCGFKYVWCAARRLLWW